MIFGQTNTKIPNIIIIRTPIHIHRRIDPSCINGARADPYIFLATTPSRKESSVMSVASVIRNCNPIVMYYWKDE